MKRPIVISWTLVLVLLASCDGSRGQQQGRGDSTGKTNDQAALVKASEVAHESLDQLAESMGWNAPGAAAASVHLGDSIPRGRIRLKELLEDEDAGSDTSEYVVDPGTCRLFPVLGAGRVQSSITLEYDKDTPKNWKMVAFGARNYTQQLWDLREEDTKRTDVDAGQYELIEVPSLNREYLQVRRDDSVELIPTADDPEAGWKKGEPVPAADVLKKLKEIGQRHREELEAGPG